MSLRTPLTTLLLLTLTLALSIPLFLYHTLVRLLSSLLHPHHTPLTPYDSIFAVDSLSHPHAANITLIYFEGRISLGQVATKFTHLLAKQNFAKLRQVMLNFGGYYFWGPCSQFSVTDHVVEGPKFDPLLEEEDHDAVLFQYLSGKMVEGFKEGRPCWDVTVLQGYKHAGTVVVLRIHHAIADGYSQNFVVDELLGCRSGGFGKPAVNAGWGGFISLLLRAPSMLTSLYADALTSPPNFYTSPKSSPTGVLSITSLPLPAYKAIRRKTHTHFASIGMSLMCGALRRFYLETHPPSTLPPVVGIMHSLPRPGHPLTTLVNHWGVGLFKIPIGVEDPLERLLKTEANFEEYTQLGFDELLHLHMPLLGWFPSRMLRRFFNLNFGTSMGFTSVPAVQEGVEWEGVRVERMGKVFGFQWGQTAIATAVYTHAGQATLTLYANKDIVPDQASINRVTRYLHEEFDALQKQVETVYKRGLKLG